MMFYEIAILNTPNIFTYKSDKYFQKGDIVEISLKNRITYGYVLKEVNKQIAKLGALAETQLDDSLTALKEKNIQNTYLKNFKGNRVFWNGIVTDL
jgi:hypothetical protein